MDRFQGLECGHLGGPLFSLHRGWLCFYKHVRKTLSWDCSFSTSSLHHLCNLAPAALEETISPAPSYLQPWLLQGEALPFFSGSFSFFSHPGPLLPCRTLLGVTWVSFPERAEDLQRRPSPCLLLRILKGGRRLARAIDQGKHPYPLRRDLRDHLSPPPHPYPVTRINSSLSALAHIDFQPKLDLASKLFPS